MSIRYFFFYDDSGQIIGEYKDNVSTTTPTDDWLVLQETVWLDDIPVVLIKKPTATSAIQTYYIHADHLNTPRVIVNTSNTVLWRWDNVHAFGANLPLEDPDNNGQTFEYNPRFPGQYFDKETNLHYNYFRYYEPETGRYISPDPIGLAGGINIYGYAKQNPLSLIDSDGLLPDAIVDRGLIAFDIASYAYNKVRGCDTSDDIASLKANTFGLFVPGATGLGLGVRAVGITNKVVPNVAQQRNLERFIGKTPANSRENIELRNLPSKGIAIQATSPGRTSGWKAVYEKQIDVNGKTIQYTKTTYRPDGSIKHVKDKIGGGIYP